MTRPAAFRIRVASASRPGHAHLVVRDQEGTVHHDGCPGFDYRGTCRHVVRAVAETDQPFRTFLADVVDAKLAGADSDPDQLAEAIRMMDEAKVRMAARLTHLRYEQTQQHKTREQLEAEAVQRFA